MMIPGVARHHPGHWRCKTAGACATCRHTADAIAMIAVGPNLSAVEPGQAVMRCPMQEDRVRHLTMMTLRLLSGTRLGSMPPVGSNGVTRDTRGDRWTLAHGAPVPCWRAALQQSL